MTVQATPEMFRVASLPRRAWTDVEVAYACDAMTGMLRAPGGTMTLRPIQAIALLEIGLAKGGFLPIRVAGGKTIISLLAPTVLGAERPLLLVPAKLQEKTRRAWRQLAQHWRIHPSIRILSYELLSRVQSRELLEQWRPDVIVCDEAHKLKDKKIGTTKRVRWYLDSHPGTAFVDMSGTITKRSIKDYAHRAGWALGAGSPLPHDWRDLETWSAALDEQSGSWRSGDAAPEDPGALTMLGTGPIREVFRDRCHATLGWVATQERELSIPLIGDVVRLPVPPKVASALTHLRATWSSPDEQEDYEYAPEVWAHARQIGLGFWYTWHNHKAATTWLAQTLKDNEISHTERRILNAFVHTTESDTDLAAALEILKSSKTINARGTWPLGTGSLSTSTLSYLINSTALATSAREGGQPVTAGGAVFTCPSTTTIKPAELEACSALFATERSACWAILLKAFPRLLGILSAFDAAAKPPPVWRAKRKAWGQWVRHVLGDNQRRLATPLDVANACDQGHYPDALRALEEWRTVRPTFVPTTKPVWIDSFAVEWAARELAKDPPCLLWTEHRAFAERISQETGVPFYRGGGKDATGRSILDHRGGPAICSIKAIGEGFDLQTFSRNVVASAPTSGRDWEQLLGRTLREGQLAEEIGVVILSTCDEHDSAISQAKADAEYIETTTGQRQALLTVDWI